MEPSISEVKRFIEHSLDTTISDTEKDLFALGVIDSLQSVNLIVQLEKTFHVKLSIVDFADNANFTLKNITETLIKKRRAAP